MSKIPSLGIALALAAAAAATHLAHADPRKDPRDPYARGASTMGETPKPPLQALSADPSAAPEAAKPPEPDPKVAAGEPKPWAPVFDVAFPEGASAAPTREEWDAAPPAREVRVTNPGCKAQRVREWYRVACGTWIEMISGGREGVSFECRRSSPQDENCDVAAVIFPARRGDRRAFEIFSWGRWGPSADAIVTEQFLEGDPAPLVTAHGLHWGF